ncbi:AAA family ATPase [Mycoplasmopsis sturni]|uniref:hypothetical protein n=1 Tax=Mycoplasmopsis sturni TaxID=39047 RepID=UPI00055D98EF|nr:hypothetical protein [Mycoplasmopsis sturni]
MQKNKFKKFFKLFVGSVAVGASPLVAMSCLYENEPSVLFANKYKFDNAYLRKPRIAQNDIQPLKDFENQLFNNVIVEYSFDAFSYNLGKTFTLNNDHLKVIAPKTYNFNEKDNAFEYLENSIQNNDNAIEEVRKDITEINAIWKNLFPEYNAEAQLFLSKIEKAIKLSLGSKVLGLNEEETSFYNGLSKLINFSYYNFGHPEQIITYEKVENIVKNYLKDTPFYAKFLEDNANPNPEKRPITYTLSNNIVNIDGKPIQLPTNFIYKYKYNVPFNFIVANHFESMYDQIVGGHSKKEVPTLEAYKKIYQYMSDIFFKVSPDAVMGIAAGFGPIFLVYGINPNSNSDKKDINFIIFNDHANLNSQEVKEFFNSPAEFVFENPEKAFLKPISDIEVEIEKNQNNIKQYELLLDDPVAKEGAQDLINLAQTVIDQLQKKKDELNVFKEELYLAAKNYRQALKEEKSAQELQELRSLLEAKWNQIKDKDENGSEISAFQRIQQIINKNQYLFETNIYSLVLLYAQLLFTLSSDQVEIVKGHYKNSLKAAIAEDKFSKDFTQLATKLAELETEINYAKSLKVAETDAELIQSVQNLVDQIKDFKDNFAYATSEKEIDGNKQTVKAHSEEEIQAKAKELLEKAKTIYEKIYEVNTNSLTLDKWYYRAPENDYYWLEFKDNKDGKWKFVDVYKGWLAYQKNKAEKKILPNYDINNEILEILPNDLVVATDQGFKSHLK